MPLLPPVKWAQRNDRVFVTFDLQDSRDPELTVTNDEETKSGKISFRAKAHSHATGPEEHAYAQDLELFDEVDVEDVKEARTDRTVTAVLAKKTPGEYWPRLLKAAGRAPQNVKVDWDKWVDEDEEGADDDGGFDPSMLQGLGGGGAGGGAGGFDLSALQGLGGGAGGFDLSALQGSAGLDGLGAGDDDSDESGEEADDVPALETPDEPTA